MYMYVYMYIYIYNYIYTLAEAENRVVCVLKYIKHGSVHSNTVKNTVEVDMMEREREREMSKL